MYYNEQIIHKVIYGDSLYNLAQRYNTTIDDILNRNPYANPYYLSVGQLLNIMPGTVREYRAEPHSNAISRNAYILNQKMRLAWEQHVYWTRLFIVSAVSKLKDINETTTRLVQTAKDISDLFEPYYGREVANNLTKLFTEHIVVAGDLVKAAVNKDTANVERLTKDWYRNGDEITNAFANINPYYNKEDVRKMFYTHLDLTIQELEDRLKGKHAEEINIFNQIEQEALMMADYFANGIVRQFPQKFST